MKYSAIFMTIIFLMILSSPVFPVSESGGQAGAFLDIGIGARAIALGKAYSGLANDGTAIFWNPGGMVLSDKIEFSAMHAFIFEDRAVNYAAVGYPFSGNSFGAGWIRYGVNDIQERDNSGQLISEFSDSENLFMLGYGRALFSDVDKSINLGTTLRYYYHSLFNYHGSGWGVDFGGNLTLQDTGPAKYLYFSIVTQNIGAEMKWNTPADTKENIPLSFRFGSAVELQNLPITVAIDLDKQEDRSIRFHSGIEYVYNLILPLRAGFNYKYISAGIGYVMEAGNTDIIFDYAFTDDPISDKGLHFFSVGIRF